ncbi:MAG: hypothetical protein ABI904_09155 [Chloroflexota bacterium]
MSNGKVIAKGESEWVYVDATTGRPIALPAGVEEFFPVLPDPS